MTDLCTSTKLHQAGVSKKLDTEYITLETCLKTSCNDPHCAL